jgi:hypothetical protein
MRRLGCSESRKVPALSLGALVCAVALAACGSSNSSHNAASVRQAAGIKFADCMRSHGVPNFPDPGSGGGIQFNAGSGIDPQSPAFRAAQNACFRLLPGGGPGHGGFSEARKQQMLRLAKCMRAHGVPSFPDPTSRPPSLAGGFGIAFGGPGSFLAVPQSLMKSPAFLQAAAACGFPGRGRPPKAAAVGG